MSGAHLKRRRHPFTHTPPANPTATPPRQWTTLRQSERSMPDTSGQTYQDKWSGLQPGCAHRRANQGCARRLAPPHWPIKPSTSAANHGQRDSGVSDPAAARVAKWPASRHQNQGLARSANGAVVGVIHGNRTRIARAAVRGSKRNIGGVIPDVVIQEVHDDAVTITQHPVEYGAAVSDHAYREPSQVMMTIGGRQAARADQRRAVPIDFSKGPAIA